jgi:hypothetical protein
MSDELTPIGEKEYWHDKRPGSSRAAASLPRRTSDRPAVAATGLQVVTPTPVRTIRDLRHPIAVFVLATLAVISVVVGLLAVTGDGALPVPPMRLANCARPGSPVLGASGAQFTAAFPAGSLAPLRGPAVNDWCFYGSPRRTATTRARWSSASRPLPGMCMRTAGRWVASPRHLIGSFHPL